MHLHASFKPDLGASFVHRNAQLIVDVSSGVEVVGAVGVQGVQVRRVHGERTCGLEHLHAFQHHFCGVDAAQVQLAVGERLGAGGAIGAVSEGPELDPARLARKQPGLLGIDAAGAAGQQDVLACQGGLAAQRDLVFGEEFSFATARQAAGQCSVHQQGAAIGDQGDALGRQVLGQVLIFLPHAKRDGVGEAPALRQPGQVVQAGWADA